jgi:exodeoxyribonuclease V alpha subunit
MELDPKQLEAVQAACDITKRVVAVTGAAGTGKTTVLKQIHKELTDNGYTVALCSPTGKAAKRIYEATGIDAMTIHRLLEFTHPGDPDPKTGKPSGLSLPRRHKQNRLEFDVILADEYAMVNHETHRCLFDALPAGGCIRLFGDINQLAPVEEDKRLNDEPSPFKKILENKEFTAVVLERVYRQGEDSGILMNANMILKSRMPTKNDQWAMKTTDKPIDVLRDYLFEMEEEGCSFRSIENQILVPQNTSWVGTRKLNTMIQGLFHNETEPCLWVDRKPWIEGENGIKGGKIRMYKGDKVICTSNLYDLGVFNGETGVILEINDDTGEIVVDFGDREQAFPPLLMVQNSRGGYSSIDPRKELDLAYAITTHKSQGSEFRRVVYILNKSNMYMISRRNFYTAVTRAKEHVFLICDQKGLSQAIYKRD